MEYSAGRLEVKIFFPRVQTASLPPGTRTRLQSIRLLPGFCRYENASRLEIESNESDSNGRSSAFPTTYERSGYRSRAFLIMPGLISIPAAVRLVPSPRYRSKKSPVPHPMSRR
ncbi:MAG: hypothetical protein BWY05_00606 [Euryarchaeota archaeon ADurb.Bin165]|nr:MAG: hypothetical protein BWY05_00606 [Euryarchaeota archaeon ADurb.Bin165]